MNITDQGTRLLAIVIIHQAVKDYKHRLKTGADVLDLERFFRSTWFDSLIEERISGEVIIQEVRKQVENGNRKKL